MDDQSLTNSTPTWFRVNVGIAQHPKLQCLRFTRRWDAAWLYIDSLGYAVEHLTDGWVPSWMPAARGYRARDADALVEVGLWHPVELDDHADGWLIHDFLAHQKSKAQWQDENQQRRERARRAAQARWSK